MTPEVEEYTNSVIQELRIHLPQGIPIEKEWRTITDMKSIYCPRIDISIGPFSMLPGEHLITEYDSLMDSKRPLVEKLIDYSNSNFQDYLAHHQEALHFHCYAEFDALRQFNRNARCLIAIEIENEVSQKHLLGGAANASALARIGICLGWKTENIQQFIKLQLYWEYLAYLSKNTFSTKNMLVLNSAQLLSAISGS